MRSNPIYDNICWLRFGQYQYHKCEECSKKVECDDTIGAQLDFNGLSKRKKSPTISLKCDVCGAKMQKRSEKMRKPKGRITPIYAYFYCTACDHKNGIVYGTIRN